MPKLLRHVAHGNPTQELVDALTRQAQAGPGRQAQAGAASACALGVGCSSSGSSMREAFLSDMMETMDMVGEV